MSHPVFISYARSASATDARALADSLKDLAFFDTDVIDDGDIFPQRVLDGILDARVVVIFATKSYTERRFCRLEMRLALAGCDATAKQFVLALGDGWEAVLDAMPASFDNQSWPAAAEQERLNKLVRQRLNIVGIPIRDRLVREEAQKLVAAFLEESKVPEPHSLQGIVCSLPPGMPGQSIGARFVGRADHLRHIHRILLEGTGGAAQLSCRISAAGGFGKTRLAVEYLHRYGPQYYPGGIFWVRASSQDIELEFWRVLNALKPTVPDLATMRSRGRNITLELERALRRIGQPALYVVDDIPEAAPGKNPRAIADFCPALGAVTVLATSRQDTREANVRTIPVGTLGPEAAILLLTETVPGAGTLSWAEWGRIAKWVGDLPLALDLLNRSLVLNAISPRDLLVRADAIGSFSGTGELDSLSEAFRGQVPGDAIRGVTEAFSISFERLDEAAKSTARVLAQLAPTPIPEAFLEALPDELKSQRVRVALVSRHFVTSGEELSFGVMHRLMADFLRSISQELELDLFVAACRALLHIMTPDHCRAPQQWPLMNLCRPHAEELVTRGLNRDTTAIPSSALGDAVGILACAQGDYSGARQLQERVSAVRTRVLGEEDPSTLSSMNNLALTFSAQGDYAGARQLLKQVAEVRRRVLGIDHPDTLIAINNLAEIIRDQGDRAGARQLQELLLKVSTRVLGKDDPKTLTSMNNLALTLREQGDYVGARQLLERVVEVRTRVLGEEHPNTLMSMDNLGETLREQGDYAGARPLLERAVEVSTRVLGKEHPDTLVSMNNLALTLREQGDYAGAQRLQEWALEVATRVLGEEHPNTLLYMNNLAVMLREQGDYARIRQLLERVLEVRTRVLGEEHPDTLESMNNLANMLKEQRDYAGAWQLLKRVLEVRRRVLGKDHPDTTATARACNALRRRLSNPRKRT